MENGKKLIDCINESDGFNQKNKCSDCNLCESCNSNYICRNANTDISTIKNSKKKYYKVTFVINGVPMIFCMTSDSILDATKKSCKEVSEWVANNFSTDVIEEKYLTNISISDV